MDFCDESKCVATGLSSRSNGSFTCYGDDGNYYPRMCADGYEPRVIPSVPSVSENAYPWWAIWEDGEIDSNITLQYFTCCPPEVPRNSIDRIEDFSLQRSCSDPSAILAEMEDSFSENLCNNTVRPYLRRMKTNRMLLDGIEWETGLTTIVDSFMCCDSSISKQENTTMFETSFLDGTECVPYHDDFYRHQLLKNHYGKIYAAHCELEAFQYAHRITEDTMMESNNSSMAFECCRSGPSIVFDCDTAFRLTIYPHLILSSIAVFTSTVMILALTIPLFLPKNRPNQSRSSEAIQGTPRSSNFSTAATAGNANPSYSPYNLYLIYLAIPDAIANLLEVVLLGSYTNQQLLMNFRSSIIAVYPYDILQDNGSTTSILMWYATSNMWLNAVVAGEIFTLLEDSHKVRKHTPPTRKKVHIQAAFVFAFSITICAVLGTLQPQSQDRAMDFLQMTWIVYKCVAILPPFLYVMWVAIKICRSGYLEKNSSDQSVRAEGLRQLAWYFARIIAIFLVAWIPAIISSLITVFVQSKAGDIANGVLLLCLALQPTVSNFVAMTKSDVKKYVFDLLTLSYIRRTRNAAVSEADQSKTHARQRTSAIHAQPRLSASSIPERV